MKIFATDIRDRHEFPFEGDKIKVKECLDEEKHIYLYERCNSEGRIYAYELVRGKPTKNPDGSIVYRYPSTTEFGSWGFFIAKNHLEKGIEKLLTKLAALGSKSKKVEG